jgi:basic amino acid/polyamine antiporter, APA family
MALVRFIRRWTMTALIVNCIIGGAIFGVPGELTRLLGRASPFAMVCAALGMAIIMLPITEVASQFSDSGGPYLYVRYAFGHFAGIQIGWFHLLTVISTVAALSNLFVDHLSTILPSAANVWARGSIIAILIAAPAIANYVGVQTGSALNNAITIAKLSPLLLLAVIGLLHFGNERHMIRTSEITSPGFSNWARAMVFGLFLFGGWEDALIPTGEICEPRRTIPFGLGTGLAACAALFVLLQFVTVATIGTKATDTPLPAAAAVLLGRGGALFVLIAAMVSISGWIAADLLNAPRLVYSLAAARDFPSLFARLHSRFHTPTGAIVLYALMAWVLAVSGGFLWAAAVSAGSTMVYYAVASMSLIRLRELRPNSDAFRIPIGSVLSVLGTAISIALLAGLKRSELLLMCVTVLIATVNWLWAKSRYEQPTNRM